MNRRQEAKLRTRAKILATAKGLFETSGYEAATIRKIADAAGMSTGAVFAHWPDKEAVYLEAFGHPPVTPETGRAALIALGYVLGAFENKSVSGDPLIRQHCADVLELARFPVEIWPQYPAPGQGFRHYALGREGETVDVTPVGG